MNLAGRGGIWSDDKNLTRYHRQLIGSEGALPAYFLLRFQPSSVFGFNPSLPSFIKIVLSNDHDQSWTLDNLLVIFSLGKQDGVWALALDLSAF